MSANDSLPPLTSPDRHNLQAQHLWLEDNGLTQMITVSPEHPEIDLPDAAARFDNIAIYDPLFGSIAVVNRPSVVLNISYNATRGLKFGDHGISFSARITGKAYDFYVPYSAIMSIHGRGDMRTYFYFPRRAFVRTEEGHVGMLPDEVWFGSNTERLEVPVPKTEEPVKPARSRAHLSVVK
jgi:stringent starvation protein B